MTLPVPSPRVVIVRHDTPAPSCPCGNVLRLRTSLAEGLCCCCRNHPPDEACRICTTPLYDSDGTGELCQRCQVVA